MSNTSFNSFSNIIKFNNETIPDDITTPLTIKGLKRIYVLTEPIVPGLFLYTMDTHDGFFDEDTKTRISFGKIPSVELNLDLVTPTENEIDTFKVVMEDLTLHYASKDGWIKIETREQLMRILGGINKYYPYSFIKDGRLIAPITFSHYVFNKYGIPVDEIIDDIEDYVDNIKSNGFDASQLTSGVIDYDRIPKEARMDFVVVANREERLKLTENDVQKYDVVQEADTGEMYFITDNTKLNEEDGYRSFTVGSIPWSSILNKPLSLTIDEGAIGSVSFNTADTLASQKLVLHVKLNMDYADNGVLSKERGGTGNQIGKASYIEYTKNNNVTANLMLLGEEDKVFVSDNIKVSGGIIEAVGFKQTNNSVPNVIYNVSADTIVFDKPDGEKSISVKDGDNIYNILNFDNGLNIGDSITDTNIYGKTTTIRATDSLILQIGDESSGAHTVKLDKTIFEVSNPVKVNNKLTLNNSDSNDEYISFGGISKLFSTVASKNNSTNVNNNETATVTFNTSTSSLNGFILNSNNNIIFRKSGNNIMEVTDNGTYVNGNIGINKELHVKGNTYIEGMIYGKCRQAVNADTLDGVHVDELMKKDGSNNTNPSVMVQSSEPTGRTNCLWVDSSTGIVKYWDGSEWTPISNTWKT